MNENEVKRLVYTADEIQEILGLGRSMTYIFLDRVFTENGPFKVIKVGKLYRIPKKSFDEWLDNQ